MRITSSASGWSDTRGDNDPPVTVRPVDRWHSGKNIEVSTHINAVNKQSGETQRNFVETRTFLTQGDHVFRSEFVDDQGIENIPESARMTNKQNIFPDTMEIAGPFPPDHPLTLCARRFLHAIRPRVRSA